MVSEKYLMLNLDDEKSAKVAEIIGNKTCKKILGVLAEKELSETDIAHELGIALNTVDYNVKKLLDATLIEKSKAYFWSVKGKKIPTYRLANKKILISTKSNITGLLSSILVGGIVLGAVKLLINSNLISAPRAEIASSLPVASDLAYTAAIKSTGAISQIGQTGLLTHAGIWAIIGVALGALVYFILKKVNMGSRPHFEGLNAFAKMQTLVKGGLNKI